MLVFSGIIRADCLDGVTLGHPCCSHHNCSNPLTTNRAHYCAVHRELEDQCAVVGCERVCSKGWRVCDNQDHRQIEMRYVDRGKSQHQLKDRLRRQGIVVPEDTFSHESNEFDDDDEILPRANDGNDCGEKSDLGNRQPKARFGRRRTHNEMLVVTCCGLIISRATMFGAEGIVSVKVRAHCLCTLYLNTSI